MKGFNVAQMMKQAKKMQEELARKQEELSRQTFEASSGGGMVTATVNGKMELLGIKIDKEVVNKEDVEMLQDLVLAAVSGATTKAKEAAQSLMSGMLGGAGMPDMGSLLG